jgi:hypothetical protein
LASARWIGKEMRNYKQIPGHATARNDKPV